MVREAEQNVESTVQGFVLALEMKAADLGVHVLRVEAYAMNLGRRLGLPASDLWTLRLAARLHDVGKLAVSDHIVRKRGPLTDTEYREMRTHPVTGANMIRDLNLPRGISETILCHHERWDGNGYPGKLSRQTIPLLARIVTLADCFDAMTSHRSYRRALSVEQVASMMRQESGRAFDPVLLERFLDDLPPVNDAGRPALCWLPLGRPAPLAAAAND
jgi:putative nucleotidyltransferase with HDIG domain